MRRVETSAPGGNVATGSDGPPVAEAGVAVSWQPPKSRVAHASEEAALACIRDSRYKEALTILMTAYGAPIVAFALRILRDREAAKDVRQHVFIDAYRGLNTFEGRSSLWSWLCGIAYHRCLDHLKSAGRRAVTDFDVLDELGESSEHVIDADRIAKQRAIERCLGKLPESMRTQVLMRCFLGLSYEEIGTLVGDAPGTVQVRISRILPRLRRCLTGEGVSR
jgi:RNA polymerase sigma-70 factor, ECF subfamily